MKNKLIGGNAEDRKAVFYSKEDGRNFLEHRQDAEPIIQWVKDRAHMPDDKDFKFIATIPQATLDTAFIEGWFHDRAAWEKWMADNPKFTAKWHK